MSNITDLQQALRGRLIQQSDAGFDEARQVYNAMHDKRPALIIQAADTADVVASLNHARINGLDVAVRGGGHSVPGYGTCDGGLVIDLGLLNHVVVDPENRIVQAGGGCTLGGVDHATHAYGLAVPGGTVSSTGLGGLTLGGGMGHLSRSCGLSIDNLVGAEVVTANGDIVHCSEDNEPDLFWAIRGGGGNFGVVTSFAFVGHHVPSVFAGPTFFEPDAQVIRNYQRLVQEAPWELNAILAFAQAPPAPFVPEAWHLKPVIGILSCWSGDDDQDEDLPDMVASAGKVVGQAMWRMPYPQVNTFFDELLPRGLRHYWKASAAREFPEGAIAAHMEYGTKVPTIEGGNFIFSTDGACHQVDEQATAFANRSACFSSALSAIWHQPEDDQRNIQWVRDYYDALAPHSDPGAYINFMADDEDMDLDSNFGAKYLKLRELKAQYDPDNLFHHNQNIPPA
ncbi:MAG: FAD-binding oxidoreductase [Xanthomonadales bacterium]|nr:FAD-binding oxidoreductase [Xanthomonadales bacterium]